MPLEIYHLITVLMLISQTTTQTLDPIHNPFSKINCRIRPGQIKAKAKHSELQDYQLQQAIGEGGFGFVRKAVHIPTGETVAVKICSISGCQLSQIRSIEREIELQRHLMHENIAQIYEVVRTNSKIYIFMEYCKNGELFQRINRGGPMPEKDAAKIFHQILSALLYLRRNNVSHRDIKPQNILFDKQWNVKIIDFGFSCPFGEGQLRRTVCGTPSYIAPEIIRRGSYDPELADVWCLGVTLYAMLAAQLPFEAETPQKRKANILALKYNQQNRLSVKAQKLIASIFVEAQYRPRLQDLLVSEFALSYQQPEAMCINFRNESFELEGSVVELLSEQGVDMKKVNESIKTCKLNKYRALYFLTLKKQQRQLSNSKVTLFRKHRNSTLKLIPITSRTPSLCKKKESEIVESDIFTIKLTPYQQKNGKGKTIRILAPHQAFKDPSKARLRRNSIDSPRRLLDCLAAYKLH